MEKLKIPRNTPLQYLDEDKNPGDSGHVYFSCVYKGITFLVNLQRKYLDEIPTDDGIIYKLKSNTPERVGGWILSNQSREEIEKVFPGVDIEGFNIGLEKSKWNIEKKIRKKEEQINDEDTWLLEKNGENYQNLIEELNSNKEEKLPNQFKMILETLKKRMQDEVEFWKNFSYSKVSNNFAWVNCPYNIIGNSRAHYEIIINDGKLNRSKENYIFIDLHFESKIKNENDIFKNKIEDLPKGLEWKKWGTSKSIRVEDGIKIDAENVVDELKEKLILIENSIGNQVREILKSKNEGGLNMSGNMKNIPLNQILYGPPGTGKTYHTVNRALEILGVNLEGKSRKEIKDIYKTKVQEGQIVFTTFHQSMSYEDFIEGIKPIEPLNEGDPVIYKTEDGIFKLICNGAAKRENSNIDDILDRFKEKLSESKISLKTSKLKKDFEVGYEEGRDTLHIYPTDSIREKPHSLNIERIKDKYLNPDLKNFTTNEAYVLPILNYLFDNMDLKKYENLTDSNKKYVLIIDEINRGNVSQIFGELITLIEDDKRKGRDEELEVILPYSKKPFTVPDNLYIIGTMNTADRSVEALDTALRRRFSFFEMPSKPYIIPKEGKAENGEINGINLESLLIRINQRIEKLLDRDHCIGHSYLLNIDSIDGLKSAFKDKIIPLLQEYFYGDYGKIGLVLGDGFVELVTSNAPFAKFNSNYEHSGLDERMVFKLKPIDDMNDMSFVEKVKSIYAN